MVKNIDQLYQGADPVRRTQERDTVFDWTWRVAAILAFAIALGFL